MALIDRTGLLLTAPGQSGQVFSEIQSSLIAKGGKATDAIFIDKIGNDILALRDKVLGAKQVVTEVSVLGFLDTMIKNGTGTLAERLAARDVLAKLSSNVSVFVDEAHINFDPNTTFIQNGGDSTPLEAWVKNSTNVIGDVLAKLEIMGDKVDITAKNANGEPLIAKDANGQTQFTTAGKEAIARELAIKMNIPKESIFR